MQLANVPRWSLHGEVMPGKLGLQPAAEGSFPLAGGEGVCPTEQCKQWGRGSWGTPPPPLPYCSKELWTDLECSV